MVASLQTARFTIAPLHEHDIAAQADILAILFHPDFSGFMGLGPHNPDGNQKYIMDALVMNADDTPSCIMTIKDGETCVGILDSVEIEGDLDLGYFIAPGHWGKGIAEECLPSFVRWRFSTGTSRLTATSHPDNKPSAKLLGNLGFVQTGRKPRDYNDGHAESLTWLLTPEDFIKTGL